MVWDLAWVPELEVARGLVLAVLTARVAAVSMALHIPAPSQGVTKTMSHCWREEENLDECRTAFPRLHSRQPGIIQVDIIAEQDKLQCPEPDGQ